MIQLLRVAGHWKVFLNFNLSPQTFAEIHFVGNPWICMPTAKSMIFRVQCQFGSRPEPVMGDKRLILRYAALVDLG